MAVVLAMALKLEWKVTKGQCGLPSSDSQSHCVGRDLADQSAKGTGFSFSFTFKGFIGASSRPSCR